MEDALKKLRERYEKPASELHKCFLVETDYGPVKIKGDKRIWKVIL